jgi:MoaA/NifB/PqqE/SkfB family radical SAM enzyme
MFSVSQFTDTLQRYRTLSTHRIHALPIVVLMPHSACNCRCVMCDIWKGNKQSKQLTEADIVSLLNSLKKLHTKRVILSGGEALLNRHVFEFCDILKSHGLKITLLTTGMSLHQHAESVCRVMDEVIVSLDGDEARHDEIRNIKGAYSELARGVQRVLELKPQIPVKARCVIHRYNFQFWSEIVQAAKNIGLHGISFLPADVSSSAFNRPEPWEENRVESVVIPKENLPLLQAQLQTLIQNFTPEFETRYIAESPEKLAKIVQYYRAIHGLAAYPHKRCNAPWVSTVVKPTEAFVLVFFLILLEIFVNNR